eukprot:4179328-Pyramimonas_sp.AAC.1
MGFPRRVKCSPLPKPLRPDPGLTSLEEGESQLLALADSRRVQSSKKASRRSTGVPGWPEIHPRRP